MKTIRKKRTFTLNRAVACFTEEIKNEVAYLFKEVDRYYDSPEFDVNKSGDGFVIQYHDRETDKPSHQVLVSFGDIMQAIRKSPDCLQDDARQRLANGLSKCAAAANKVLLPSKTHKTDYWEKARFFGFSEEQIKAGWKEYLQMTTVRERTESVELGGSGCSFFKSLKVMVNDRQQMIKSYFKSHTQ